MTNYDRIKSMSVEEMADLLTVELLGLAPCKLYQALPTGRTYISKTMAMKNVKQWLESEVEAND